MLYLGVQAFHHFTATGKLANAATLLEFLLPHMEGLDSDNWQWIKPRFQWYRGEFLLKRGRLEDAEEHLAAASTLIEEIEGLDSRDHRRVSNLLRHVQYKLKAVASKNDRELEWCRIFWDPLRSYLPTTLWSGSWSTSSKDESCEGIELDVIERQGLLDAHAVDFDRDSDYERGLSNAK
jgi:hypothetical protein